MIEMIDMCIKSKKSILLNLTGVCLCELMPTSLFVVNNASKTCPHFSLIAYQWVNPVIRQEIVSQRRKHAPIMDIHRCPSANVIINKNVTLIYDLPYENRGIPGKIIRAPPSCRA